MVILIATENELYKKGLYGVRVENIEPKNSILTDADGTTTNSTYLRWSFMLLKRGFEGKTISANSSTAFGPSSKGRKWAEALLDRQLHVNEPVDTDDLIGLTAIATVGIVKKGEKTYNEIEALTPVDDEEQHRPAPERPIKEQDKRVQQTGPQILVGQNEFDAALAERKQTIADEKRYREAVPRQQVSGFPQDIDEDPVKEF